MEILFYILVGIFGALTLWLGAKILEKAGLDKRWVFCLLIPAVNIFMIWVFAFSIWPSLRDDVNQDLN